MQQTDTLIERLTEELGWPEPSLLYAPPGAGPAALADQVQMKIERPLRRLVADCEVRTGVLMADPRAASSDPPIAIICEFSRPVGDDVLKEAHALAWSFSKAPILVVVTPDFLRVWSCYEPPQETLTLGSVGPEIASSKISLDTPETIAESVGRSLHWVNLVTGEFFHSNRGRFPQDQRADRLLLDNLKELRRLLNRQNLADEYIHPLLGRVIFVQFLFHRKDSRGEPALNERVLKRLNEQGVLQRPYQNLPQILSDYEDAYSLFKWLNEIFNGDLFPGNGEDGWREEMNYVRAVHLRTLAEFVAGDTLMAHGQRCLWPLYRFGAIPLEFISSIYEEFLSGSADSSTIHYTPPHVVDFLLDQVLPWRGNDWDLRILDPACGSGVFLVKSYQRLVYRWRQANPGDDPPARLLRTILERNIVGVDRSETAIRVASFSLYLAMCDEVDPRHYWTLVRFPTLRRRSLLPTDFFAEDLQGIRTESDAESFDLVVGNAPWGKNTLTPLGKQWTTDFEGPALPNADQAPLFLLKGARLTKPNGSVVMLQPAGILFNGSRKAIALRECLFSDFGVSQVVNFSLLRWGLFARSISPSCSLLLRLDSDDDRPVTYICPRPTSSNEEVERVVIEPHHISRVSRREAATDEVVWTALATGGPRDLLLIRRLRDRGNLQKLEDTGRVQSSEGIIPRFEDSKTKVVHGEVVGRPILDGDFPPGTFQFIDPEELPLNTNPLTQRRTSMDAFQTPQLIVKQGIKRDAGRLQAAMVKEGDGGVLCTQSFVSIHASEQGEGTLEAAWLGLNSCVAFYYLAHASRVALYRPETLKRDVMAIPLPKGGAAGMESLATWEEVDQRAIEAYDLKESERLLVADFLRFRVPPGLATAEIDRNAGEPSQTARVVDYCRTFIRVLDAAFGGQVSATVMAVEPSDEAVAMRIAVIHLDHPLENVVNIETRASRDLYRELGQLNRSALQREGSSPSIAFRRILRLYDTVTVGDAGVPSLIIAKPDQPIHWSQGVALQDADEVAAEAMLFQQGLTARALT